MRRAHGLCYWTVIAGLFIGGLIVAWNALAWDPSTLWGGLEKPQPPTPRYIFSFGDSFSSTGFDVESAEYPTIFNPIGNPAFPGQTSCNGPNWVGVLIGDLAPSATMLYNFAHAGATIDRTLVPPIQAGAHDLLHQAKQFKEHVANKPGHARWKKDNSAAVIWLGTNDVTLSRSHALVGLGEGAAEDSEGLNDRIMDTYIRNLDSLVQAGVRTFALINVPPVNRNPKFSTSDASLAKIIEEDIQKFNEQFSKRLSRWIHIHDRSAVRLIDSQSIFHEVLNDPHRFNATDSQCMDPKGKKCLWTDYFHPGQAVQNIMGHRIYDSLGDMGFWNPPIPAQQPPSP